MIKLLTIGLVSVIGFVLTSVIASADCSVGITGSIAFGSLNQGEISSIQNIILTLTGDSLLSFDVSGGNWSSTSATFDVTATRFALTSQNLPYGSMTPLSESPQSLGTSLPLDLSFATMIPAHQASGDYSQAITFAFSC